MTRGSGLPTPPPHLELSLPCDLRKFLSRFLDRKATSSSLVLEKEWAAREGLLSHWPGVHSLEHTFLSPFGLPAVCSTPG